MTKNIFGTDGIRLEANTSYLQPEWLRKIGSEYVKFCGGSQNKPVTIAVGQDTRESSPAIFKDLAAGIKAAGGTVLNLGTIPTAVVSIIAQTHKDAVGGIMITASHNPYNYNGLKFFDNDGYKLKSEQEQQISQAIIDSPTIAAPSATNIVDYRQDAIKTYLSTLELAVGGKFSFNQTKVVIDYANGATSKIVPVILKTIGIEVVALNNAPDGKNINDNCGSTHPQTIQQHTLKNFANLGIAFDGDGDRAVFCDDKGVIVEGEQLMALFALDLKKHNKLNKNTVTTTVMSNLALDHFLADNDIATKRVNVGDKYISYKLRENDTNFGGETSGHILFNDFCRSGDGLLTALKLLTLIDSYEAPLSSIIAKTFKLYPQYVEAVNVDNKKVLMERAEIATLVKQLKSDEPDYRILIRPSGTENVIRVLVEGSNAITARKMVAKLVELIKKL
ncbi:MAG: phosphoglucosamine mutase [Pseudomonadota bacterium]